MVSENSEIFRTVMGDSEAEIEEKRSTLSANQRLFVKSFKLDFIKELLEV